MQDRYWINGANTLIFPTDIGQGGYYWGENIINRGGIVATRPGKNLIFSLPGTRAQGMTLYRPYREREQLVWSVDGNIYWSEWPFETYAYLPRVQFWSGSPQVYFCQARQATRQNPDGSLTVLEVPIDVLFMQDGYTPSAFYIATSSTASAQSGHNQAGAPWNQLPVGTVMAYSGYRLWSAYRETIFASDLMNPNSFTEGTYLATANGFKLPEPATGMLNIPASPGSNDTLIAFTPWSITSLQSGIIDRTQWQQTPNFQQIVSADFGTVAPFSPVNQFGLPWFYSEEGLVNLNEALNQYRSSMVNPRDGEMTRSKQNMSPVRSGICTASWYNWLLVSVPSGSRWNRHTWVMDGSPQAQLSTQAAPAYAGIWTGTFPVQYVTGEFQDVPRCFELAYSCEPDPWGNHIQIWENFIGRKTDQVLGNDTPIQCSWETKVFEIAATGELVRFKYAEFDICELVGTVEVTIYYAGIKGHYRKCYDLILNAEEGVPGNDNYSVWTYSGLATDTFIETLRPQTRTIRTPDFSGSPVEQTQDDCADTCGIESPYQHNVDRGFQLLVNWTGRMAIREMRLFIDPYPQPGVGQCTPTEAGVTTNIVSAIGCLPPPNVCTIPVP